MDAPAFASSAMLGGLPAGFTVAGVPNVAFQHGTALAEGHFGGGGPGTGSVSEPETLALPGLGALLVALRRRRSRA